MTHTTPVSLQALITACHAPVPDALLHPIEQCTQALATLFNTPKANNHLLAVLHQLRIPLYQGQQISVIEPYLRNQARQFLTTQQNDLFDCLLQLATLSGKGSLCNPLLIDPTYGSPTLKLRLAICTKNHLKGNVILIEGTTGQYALLRNDPGACPVLIAITDRTTGRELAWYDLLFLDNEFEVINNRGWMTTVFSSALMTPGAERTAITTDGLQLLISNISLGSAHGADWLAVSECLVAVQRTLALIQASSPFFRCLNDFVPNEIAELMDPENRTGPDVQAYAIDVGIALSPLRNTPYVLRALANALKKTRFILALDELVPDFIDHCTREHLSGTAPESIAGLMATTREEQMQTTQTGAESA